MKAGLYIRVSTDMQARDGDSLAEQEVSTQGYCNYRNIPIVTVYREEGKSAKNTNRPQFQKMLRDCKNGKIDTVVVKKIDRLSRSLMDFEKTISFFEEHNTNLISIQENFDTSSAIGRAVIRIIVTFAQLEREQTSERTIDVLKYRAGQGLWNGGGVPLGYDNDEKLGLVINIEESKIINTIFNKYIELASYKKVAEYMNNMGYRSKQYTSRRGKNQGGNKFRDTTIAIILKNQIYLGKIKYGGEIYPGKHQPVISKDIYDKAQDIMKKNTATRSCIKNTATHNFILEGLVKCGACGAVMTPKWSLSRGKRYFYYECTTSGHGGANACSIRSISAPALESLILRRIRMLKRDDVLLKKILDSNANSFEKDISQLEAEKIILDIKLNGLSSRAKSIVDKLLTISELSHSTLLYDEVNRLEQEKANITKRIEEIDFKVNQLKNRSLNIDLAKRAFQYFTQIYGKLSNNDKKVLMGILIKDITYGKDYISINYYDRIDAPILVDNLGSKPKGNVWPRPHTGSTQNSLTQSYIDYFNTITYQAYKTQTRLDVSV